MAVAIGAQESRQRDHPCTHRCIRTGSSGDQLLRCKLKFSVLGTFEIMENLLEWDGLKISLSQTKDSAGHELGAWWRGGRAMEHLKTVTNWICSLRFLFSGGAPKK